MLVKKLAQHRKDLLAIGWIAAQRGREIGIAPSVADEKDLLRALRRGQPKKILLPKR